MRRLTLLCTCLALAFVLPGCRASEKKAKAPAKAVSAAAASRAEELYYEGVYAYGKGDTAAALALWKKVLALNPGHQPTLNAMAEARSKLKAVEALPEK